MKKYARVYGCENTKFQFYFPRALCFAGFARFAYSDAFIQTPIQIAHDVTYGHNSVVIVAAINFARVDWRVDAGIT